MLLRRVAGTLCACLMPTITDIAICVRHWDFSETSQTVSLFSREHGVMRGLAKGAKREKGRFSGGIDLLDYGEFIAIVKPGRELATLTDWTLQHIYWPVRRSLPAHRAGLYVADLANRLVTDHDPHTALFDALDTALRSLNEPETIEGTVLQFQWKALVEAGYQPQLDEPLTRDAGETLAFNPREGCIVADNGSGDRWRVRSETVRTLAAVERGSAESLSPVSIHRANLLLAAYARFLLDDEPPSMMQMFPDLRGV